MLIDFLLVNRYELVSGTSAEFWESWTFHREKDRMMAPWWVARYGRIGANGQCTKYDLAALGSKKSEKVGKGYISTAIDVWHPVDPPQPVTSLSEAKALVLSAVSIPWSVNQILADLEKIAARLT